LRLPYPLSLKHEADTSFDKLRAGETIEPSEERHKKDSSLSLARGRRKGAADDAFH
jgi:hypothetical protein